MIKLNRFAISIATTSGKYGFQCEFKSGLNIIRGDNSSGKSTLINSLFYSLGMEELIGGRGIKSLPYALKNYIDNKDGEHISIISSGVMLEIENHNNEVVTLSRPIISEDKDPKLVEIIHGPYLTKPLSYSITPTFLHDSGSAVHSGIGFYKTLEDFIGLELPIIEDKMGKQSKLYLQFIFAAMFVEQKRGWTDYIANIPYYGIADVRAKVIEYLLNLDVFENRKKLNELNTQANNIRNLWKEELYKIKTQTKKVSSSIKAVPENISTDFEPGLVKVVRSEHNSEVELYNHMVNLNHELNEIREKLKSETSDSDTTTNKMEPLKEEYDQLMVNLDSLYSEVNINEVSLSSYKKSLQSVEEDLAKNKLSRKLKSLGGFEELQVANDICPACHQSIDDSLLLTDSLIQPMSLEENISYLESQRKMLKGYISGVVTYIDTLKNKIASLKALADEKKQEYNSLRKNINSNIYKALIRKEVVTEQNISEVSVVLDRVDRYLAKLTDLSIEYTSLSADIKLLSESTMSTEDISKLKEFEGKFKSLAKDFSYGSAKVGDIKINKHNYLPYLLDLELREINYKGNADIKADSSASDFVRLIWSYLISLSVVSSGNSGNHPLLLIFDEPGQHSMGVTSVNSLLLELSKQQSIQSVVGASFDESDETFTQSTEGVNYHLIRIDEKLLAPLDS